MKRVLCVIGLILSFSCIVFGTSSSKRVFDQANLFTTNEIGTLEKQISQLQQTYQMDVVIVTTDDSQGKTSQDYADDFYDYNGFGYNNTHDGLLLLIDMDNRRVHISTTGEAIDVFDDYRIEEMVNHLLSYMRNGAYYNAAYAFTVDCNKYLDAGIIEDNVQHYSNNPSPDYTPEQPRTPLEAGGIALLVALGVTAISYAFVTHRYANPKRTNPPMIPLDVRYSQRSDRYITTHTTRAYMPQNRNNNSGGFGGGGFSGGSSTHSGSSGTTHGGGGGSF